MELSMLVPLVSVAGAIVGALITGFVTRRRDVADSAIQALTILVEKQESQITRLDGRLERLEQRFVAEEENHKITQKKKRMLEEKYSTALGYVGALLGAAKVLFHRLDEEGITHRELIPVPECIKQDLAQQFPGN